MIKVVTNPNKDFVKEVREKIKENKEYRSLPFWSWNDKLEIDRLIEQIQWMHEKGMGGFFMHARSGLGTEYLSGEWMKCVEACANEAKRLDMKAWLYDENGWPSGFVGGKLLEEEQNRDKYILSAKGAFDKNATVSYLLTEEQMSRERVEVDSDELVINNHFIESPSNYTLATHIIYTNGADAREVAEAIATIYQGRTLDKESRIKVVENSKRVVRKPRSENSEELNQESEEIE